MRAIRKVMIWVALLLLSANAAQAQTGQKKIEPPSGSISGKVTLAGQPMPETTVILQPPHADPYSGNFLQTVTDEAGRFRLTGIAAGSYKILPLAPGLAVMGERWSRQDREIVVTAGETREGVDFELTPGGVITGKITDANGQPLIAQSVTLEKISDGGEKMLFFTNATYFMLHTDDRGEYRLFGLPAGRYLVSVGTAAANGSRGGDSSRTYYPLTFYHNVTNEAQATVIEVTPGKEVTQVDIVVGRAVKSQSVLARVVDGVTGQPIPHAPLHYGTMGSNGKVDNRDYITMDAKGESLIQGLAPGRYAASVDLMKNPGYYSDPVIFEVSETTPPVIEIKAYRGASITGTVVVENMNDPAVISQLASLSIVAFDLSRLNSGTFPHLQIQPDGSFRVDGLRAGKIRLSLVPDFQKPSGFSWRRVERDGQAQRTGEIEVGANEQVTGVRVVLSYGTGVIRGQVQMTGEAPPEGVTVMVMARRANESLIESIGSGLPHYSQVDANGSFAIEGLPPGDWVLTATAIFNSAPGQPPPQPPVIPRAAVTQQTVTVTNGVVTQTKITLNLKPQEKQ